MGRAHAARIWSISKVVTDQLTQRCSGDSKCLGECLLFSSENPGILRQVAPSDRDETPRVRCLNEEEVLHLHGLESPYRG